MIHPLRKRTLTGEIYVRREAIQSKLVDLDQLACDELVARCEIQNSDDPAYVPSECLLYRIRNWRSENSDRDFERLYKILQERILRVLPRAESGPDALSLTRECIRDEVLGRFNELLVEDRVSYNDRLDYYEIGFADAIAKRRADASMRIRAEANRMVPITADESGEIPVAVERWAGSLDPTNWTDGANIDCRLCLEAAIDRMSPEQRLVITMWSQSFPIHSKNEDETTISKVLGKSERTVRSIRDKALAALRDECGAKMENADARKPPTNEG